MIPDEKVVDFNGKLLELLRYVVLRTKSWRKVYSESQNSSREERSKVYCWLRVVGNIEVDTVTRSQASGGVSEVLVIKDEDEKHHIYEEAKVF